MDFENAAKVACNTELKDLKSIFPRVKDGDVPYICLDLVYEYTLLVDGFGMVCVPIGIAIPIYVKVDDEFHQRNCTKFIYWDHALT